MSSTFKNESIQPGVYRHYKGALYLVYELAEHTESDELLVVYRPLYGRFLLNVRPYAMFLEQVKRHDGSVGPRFSFLHEVEAESFQDQDAARNLAFILSELSE